MRLIKCTITKPSVFDNKQLEFADGITFIRGKNGSGKSLMIRAFSDVLFGCFSASSQQEVLKDTYLDLCFAINPDSDESYRFRYQNDNLIIFKLNKSNEAGAAEKELCRISRFATEQQKIIETVGKIGDETLERFLLSWNKESFANLCCVPSPSDVGFEESINHNIMRGAMLNDESGFYGRFLRLKKLCGLSDSDSAIGKAIEKQQRLLNELNKDIEIIHIKNQRFEKLERERNSVNEELTELKNKEENLRKREEALNGLLADISAAEELDTRLGEIQDKISLEKKKISDIKSIEEEKNIQFSRFSFPDISDSESLDSIQTVFTRLIDNNEKQLQFKNKKAKRWKKFKSTAAFCGLSLCAAGLFLTSKSITSNLAVSLPIKLLFAGTVIAILLCAFGLYMRVSDKKKRIRLSSERDNLNLQLKQLLKENSIQIDDYKLGDLYNILLKYFEDYVGHADSQQEIFSIRAKLSDPNELKIISDEMKSLANQRDILQKRIKENLTIEGISLKDGISLIGLSVLIDEVRSAIDDVREAVKEKENLLTRIEEEKLLSANQSDDEIILKRNQTKSSLSVLKNKREAMRVIADIIDETVREQEKHQTKKLIDDTLLRFNKITNDQFKNFVNEQTAEEFITANGKSDALSPAVAHALLLSVKLALTSFCSGFMDTLPLFLDDPFLFMDDDRIGHLLEQLKEISKIRQIAVFTYRVPDGCGEKIIEL